MSPVAAPPSVPAPVTPVAAPPTVAAPVTPVAPPSAAPTSPIAPAPLAPVVAPVAPDDPNHSPFKVNIPLDLGITAGGMLIGGLPRLFAKETIRPWCGLDCKASDVNPLDRTVIGHHSDVALQLSNAGFFTSMGLPFAFGAIDALTSHPTDGAGGMLKDDLILVETLSIVLVTNNVFSFIVRRPRPRTYDTSLTDAQRLEPNNAFSFPSGHTAASFAMATAYSRLYMMRHPNSSLVVPLWIGTYSIAAMTGVLRTYAGDHFWTDVITGACTGTALGLLVPWMHTLDLKPISTGPAAKLDLHVRFAPMALDRGAGAMIVVE
ncbi:MAG: phosphatase PAP2 family protein [Byssovorax sp.]